MLIKENDELGVDSTEPIVSDEEKRFFSNAEEDDNADVGEDQDETQEEEDSEAGEDDQEAGETETEEEGLPEKVKNWKTEDYRRGYFELEKKLGEMGKELGELRKAKETQPEKTEEAAPNSRTENDIPNMTDEELDNYIGIYTDWLSVEDQVINNPKEFAKNNIQYSKLLVEKQMRTITHKQVKEQVATTNQQVVETYQKQWNEVLTQEQIDKVTKFAETKLSENGALTNDVLDVATHHLFPSIFKSHMAMTITDKERKRIANAKTSVTARVPTSGNASTGMSLISVDKLSAMDSEQRAEYLESLSSSDLAKLEKAINKK